MFVIVVFIYGKDSCVRIKKKNGMFVRVCVNVTLRKTIVRYLVVAVFVVVGNNIGIALKRT